MTIVEKVKNKILELADIKLMILFGSMARNQANDNSDIDLGIILEDINQVNRLKDEFQKLYFKRPVDLIILNNADPLLKYQVTREGKVLYEKQEEYYVSFVVKSFKEYCDTKKLRKLEEKYIKNYIEGVEINESRCTPPEAN